LRHKIHNQLDLTNHDWYRLHPSPLGLAAMASYVYFKFKSQKEPQRVTIDGPHTDVWNLKREIINISRLGDGTDFDLKVYKENSNEGKTVRCRIFVA
jgi:hypothetical protein